MKLVDNAKDALTWFSVQCMLVAGALQAGWEFLPDDLKSSLDPSTVKTVTVVLLVLGVVGRLVKQGKK
jgi:hypothetical protein